MGLISALKAKGIIQYLKTASPEKMREEAVKKLIFAVKNTAKVVPAYKDIMKSVNLDSITDYESFKKFVPIIDKSVFSKYSLSELSKHGDISTLKSVMVSSGTSGTGHSYGLTSVEEDRSLAFFTDVLLDHFFNTSKNKTLIVNALAMGVVIHSSLPIACTSVRSDMVVALMKKTAREYDQVIIACSTYFAKKIVEEGARENVWGKNIVNFIIGEDWFPESYRTYLGGILGLDFKDPEKGIVVSSMGICELGLTMFQESFETIQIRRLAESNEDMRLKIVGEVEYVPEIFHYDPNQFFVEEENNKLIFSTINPKKILPLIRYCPGDNGSLFDSVSTYKTLKECGYEDCIPKIKLPLITVKGRSSVNSDNRGLDPQLIKSGIYHDVDIAEKVTGYFHIRKQDGNNIIELQLNSGVNYSEELSGKIARNIFSFVKDEFQLRLYEYRDFPYGIELVYENKFKYQ